jgi:hypothetical protein
MVHSCKLYILYPPYKPKSIILLLSLLVVQGHEDGDLALKHCVNFVAGKSPVLSIMVKVLLAIDNEGVAPQLEILFLIIPP